MAGRGHSRDCAKRGQACTCQRLAAKAREGELKMLRGKEAPVSGQRKKGGCGDSEEEAKGQGQWREEEAPSFRGPGPW